MQQFIFSRILCFSAIMFVAIFIMKRGEIILFDCLVVNMKTKQHYVRKQIQQTIFLKTKKMFGLFLMTRKLDDEYST